jgi:VWFA-related protein
MKRTLTHLLTLLLTTLLAQTPAVARQQPQPTPAPARPAQTQPAQTPTPATTQTPPAEDVPDWLKNLPKSPAPSQGPIQISPPDVPETVEHDEDDVVRITSNLVQIDAVVTDKKGRQVTDLKPEEFEILADGKPQKITNFSYVQNVPGAAAPPATAPAPGGKPGLPAPPAPRLRPEQVRRTVAFVFNDLEMSWESVYYARRAIQKFVDEQMQPGDFVAILPASGGSGALQQFTNDKRLLNAAIRNLRWQPQFGRGIRPFEAPTAPVTSAFGEDEDEERSDAERYYYSQRRERFSVGTLNALDAVVGALRDLPGRKSLVLLSDGIPVPPREEDSGRVLAGINRVIESANRASVIIYAVDSRGLQTFDLYDASLGAAPPAPQLGSIMMARSREVSDSQRGLRALAEETGGVAFVNSNDIGGGVRRALEDQRGYYLIGYRPDGGTFDPATGRVRYHKLTLNVTRPGLKVRTRRGFFGFTGKTLTPSAVPRTRSEQLRAALVSPFPAGGVSLRLTPFFGRDEKQGAFVRSLIHIDGRDLTFRRQPDGTYKSVIDVVALTFGAKGMVVNEANVTHTVAVTERAYKQIQEAGLLYNMVVPTKKPGGYQFRIAVRDTSSERTGSASQYVEVPDVKKGRLALSGIVLKSAASSHAAAPSAGLSKRPAPARAPEPVTAAEAATAAPTGPPEDEGPASPPSDPQGSPAVRRFRRGASVDYGFYIYNAKPDRPGGRAHLQTQMRLYRDGKLVYDGPVQPFDAQPQNAQGDVGAGGQLRLGTNLAPGEYALQMVVTDLLAREKHRVTAQWVDFEIVE